MDSGRAGAIVEAADIGSPSCYVRNCWRVRYGRRAPSRSFEPGEVDGPSPSHSRPLPAPEARAEVETYTPLAPRVNTRKIIPFAKSRSFVEGWIARPSRPSKHERSNTGIEPDETSLVTPSAGPGNV